MDFYDLLNNNLPILLDGGMGTMLQEKGLRVGEYPELAALEHPDWLLDIHKAYLEAGSQIILANTFGANKEKLSRSAYSVCEVVKASVQIAKEAAEDKALVALDIGPIGQLLEPTGILSFDEAMDIFVPVVKAGVSAGADLIFIETMSDLQEARCALLAAKENSDLPAMVCMTFEERGRTFLGCDVSSCMLTLEGLGADAVGINCGLGPMQLPPLLDQMLKWTSLPLILKPNAGLPRPDGSGYDISSSQFAEILSGYIERGVKFIGGCCGTTPEYISLLSKAALNRTAALTSRFVPAAVCSAVKTVPVNRVRVIGERINPTGKKLMKEALLNENMDYILNQGLSQTEAGAAILDVNVGLPEIDEAAMMVKAVKALQGVVDTPLQIDSTKPDVIEAALRVYCGKAIINSVNGEDEVMDAVLPLVKKYGASVVGLTLDKKGIPKSAEERLAIAGRILDRALSLGIRREDIYIDCLTLTVSAEPEGAVQTLEAIRLVKERLGLKTVLGVSNISFGLPARPLINQNFLTMAMTCGLDLPIINPNDNAMMAAVASYHLLANIDKDAREFIAAYSDASMSVTVGTAGHKTAGAVPAAEHSLHELIVAGLRGEAALKTAALLETSGPMEMVDEILIPALDEVGLQFEQGKVYLPQLIQSAGAAQSSFQVIREHLGGADTPGTARGIIVLATVKGDIHDIGKNIVKVLLENYGYTVIDLGKDVEPAAVCEAVKKHRAPLVGLSALMTTTLVGMEDTISLLHKEGLDCRIMVGGAVLTADYAERIGADYYAKDARESVEIARRVIG